MHIKNGGVPFDMDLSSRIGKEFLDNRIKSDWATGSPYSMTASVCKLRLHRIYCPEQNQTIVVAIPSNKNTWTCACGAFTYGSVRVQELICDQINNALLSE
jgi:hypothetical protein